MKLEDLIIRAEQLLAKADAVLQSQRAHRVGPDSVDVELQQAFRAGSLCFLALTFGEDHIFYTDFASQVKQNSPRHTSAGKGILTAARDELSGGWLTTTKGLISAEIFADFLEMAEHLLEEDYKDPAAVVAGSVLEEHLRQLCQKNGIPIEAAPGGRARKADILNADLVKSDAYNKLDQKNVIAWLGLRNKAAHGDYEAYTKEQVALMLQSLSDFMTRVPV